jgi:hypothetical protein
MELNVDQAVYYTLMAFNMLKSTSKKANKNTVTLQEKKSTWVV